MGLRDSHAVSLGVLAKYISDGGTTAWFSGSGCEVP